MLCTLRARLCRKNVTVGGGDFFGSAVAARREWVSKEGKQFRFGRGRTYRSRSAGGCDEIVYPTAIYSSVYVYTWSCIIIKRNAENNGNENVE